MEDLEPKSVWNFFEKISEIPRCSGNEGKIREYISSVAEKNGYDYEIDDVGNVLIRKPSTVGEEVPTTVVQCHMDMVCEKDEDVDHDFKKDPISIVKDGDWLTADGTTLGADNGIGIAIALSILTKEDLKHGPLEFLFTVSEETGLDGAMGLKPDLLKGRTLLNLDSEDFGAFTIGCAGGGENEISLPVEITKVDKGEFLEVSLKGFFGGHSGLDIDKGRGNPIKLLGRILWVLADRYKEDVRIVDIKGGNKRNAIPRSAKAVINVTGDVEEIMHKEFDDIREEYSAAEEDIELIVGEAEEDYGEAITHDDSKKVLDLIRALPHGVLFMSQEVPDLVRTSTNFATIEIDDGDVEIALKTRSSSGSELQSTRDRITSIGRNFGADVTEDEAYPGWEPDLGSEILSISKKVYKELYGEEPVVEALHAGLETGLIGEKYEDMDMISMGATLENPHSTKERVHIGSVDKFNTLIINILEYLAEE